MLAKLSLDSSYNHDLAFMADVPKRRGKGNRREGISTRECEKCTRGGGEENTYIRAPQIVLPLIENRFDVLCKLIVTSSTGFKSHFVCNTLPVSC